MIGAWGFPLKQMMKSNGQPVGPFVIVNIVTRAVGPGYWNEWPCWAEIHRAPFGPKCKFYRPKGPAIRIARAIGPGRCPGLYQRPNGLEVRLSQTFTNSRIVSPLGLFVFVNTETRAVGPGYWNCWLLGPKYTGHWPELKLRWRHEILG